jgi:chromosome partitioning protein
MIITVGGTKGGSGKSTVAVNLASIAAGEGADVLLVNADDQDTASDFTAVRKEDHPAAPAYTCVKLAGANVRTEVQKISPKYDFVIIDAGGRDTTSQRAALSVSDILLIPCVPRSFDIWALDQTAAIVEEMRATNPKLEAYAFLNKADPEGQGTDNAETVKEIKKRPALKLLNAAIGNRKAFANAAAQGLSVTELKGNIRNPNAIGEIMTLYKRFFNVTSTPQKIRA